MRLKINDIYKNYGKIQALSGISLELDAGVYGLLGPNGAGKSTLIQIIVGNLKPSRGEIFYNQKNVCKDNGNFKRILGYVPQSQGIYDMFTAKQFLEYMAILKDVDKKYISKQIEKVLGVVGLTDVQNQKLGEFSGGMRQRVLIGQALLGNPQIIVLDEPTAGLDPKERIRIRNFISRIAENKIVLIATHVVSDVESIAKEIILLGNGKIESKGTPQELCGRLEGKVWECLVPTAVYEVLDRQFIISNINEITKEIIGVRFIGVEKQIKILEKKESTLKKYFLTYKKFIWMFLQEAGDLMRLVLYEWKKMFTLKIRCILLMLFSLNIGIYYIYIIPSIPTIEERNIRHKWEQELANKGEDITNSIQFIQKELEKLTPGENETLKVSNEKNMMELAVLFDIRHQYMAILEYQQFISSLKERANYIKDVSVFNKAGGFSQKNIEKTVKDFEKVEEIEIHPMDDKGMQNLHQFYLTDFFVLLFACLLSVQEYGSDFRSGMGNLIQGTPNGKIKLRFSQIQATGMGILMVALLLYGFNICITGICIGFGNLSYYVQGMSMFRNMSFPCTVGIYLVLYMSWKLFVIWFVSLIFQLFAVLLNGKNIAWIFSGGVLVISFGLWFYLPDSPLTKIFRYLNVIGLLDVRQIIGNYQNLKIFETPVLLFDAAIVFVLIVGIGLILGILFGKKFEISNIKIEFPKRNRKKVWTHGFAYEFNKVVVNQKVQWVLLALIGVSFLYAGIEKRQISAKEFYYEKYINEYEGVYTDEKAKDIKGIVEKQQYSGSEERDAVESLQCQSEYLMQLKDENKGYVNLLFWREILLNEQLEIKNMLFIVIAMLISVCNLFYYDRKK